MFGEIHFSAQLLEMNLTSVLHHHVGPITESAFSFLFSFHYLQTLNKAQTTYRYLHSEYNVLGLVVVNLTVQLKSKINLRFYEFYLEL